MRDIITVALAALAVIAAVIVYERHQRLKRELLTLHEHVADLREREAIRQRSYETVYGTAQQVHRPNGHARHWPFAIVPLVTGRWLWERRVEVATGAIVTAAATAMLVTVLPPSQDETPPSIGAPATPRPQLPHTAPPSPSPEPTPSPESGRTTNGGPAAEPEPEFTAEPALPDPEMTAEPAGEMPPTTTPPATELPSPEDVISEGGEERNTRDEEPTEEPEEPCFLTLVIPEVDLDLCVTLPPQAA